MPDPLVVRSGERARFAVRVTNAEPRPVRLVLNCPPRTRVRAADGASNLPREEEGEVLCATTGLAVDLRPGATLRFAAEVETRRWVRMDPGPDANGWTLGPDPAWEPGPALPPGQYALEVDLPSLATRGGALVTVRGALRLRVTAARVQGLRGDSGVELALAEREGDAALERTAGDEALEVRLDLHQCLRDLLGGSR
ncbi:hypothetical protein [Nannocystis pusilla]|uniref:hypothetical protein n=1 Tax=Nannocystis pusilla TaxID=889268 RepID=UPI003DA37B0A